MKVSFIIPTLNEADRIGLRVRRCMSLSPRPEVIVADGGSSDDTRLRAEAEGVRVLVSPRRGRSLQMNAGAAAASGDVFLFLHADVELGQAAYDTMLKALEDPSLAGGAFRRRFDSPSRLLRLGCRLADLRGSLLGIFLGDQAIFTRREVFLALGGFPDILLFEDLEFSRKLAGYGRTLLVKGVVVASSRRFDRRGNFRQLARNLGLTALYFAGADPARLARRYDPALFPPLRGETPVEDPGGTAAVDPAFPAGNHTGASRKVVE